MQTGIPKLIINESSERFINEINEVDVSGLNDSWQIDEFKKYEDYYDLKLFWCYFESLCTKYDILKKADNDLTWFTNPDFNLEKYFFKTKSLKNIILKLSWVCIKGRKRNGIFDAYNFDFDEYNAIDFKEKFFKAGGKIGYLFLPIMEL